MKHCLVCILAPLALCCGMLSLQGRTANAADANVAAPDKNTGNPNLVVSTQWLADHLSDPHLVIVHIGHDRGDYQAAHIPGARFLPMDKFVSNQDPGTELLPPEELKKNLEAIGIGDDSRVVYYAPDWDPMATRLFFTLDYLGHGDQAALLDGGMDRWLVEKRPTSTEEPKITPATSDRSSASRDRREDGLDDEAHCREGGHVRCRAHRRAADEAIPRWPSSRRRTDVLGNGISERGQSGVAASARTAAEVRCRRCDA